MTGELHEKALGVKKEIFFQLTHVFLDAQEKKFYSGIFRLSLNSNPLYALIDPPDDFGSIFYH
tara:strand:- start:1751 stop:1939 length:189 start_codon:yes stop_codon:yes gene_type:complete